MMLCKLYIEPPRGAVSCIINHGGCLVEQALNRVFPTPFRMSKAAHTELNQLNPCIPDNQALNAEH